MNSDVYDNTIISDQVRYHTNMTEIRNTFYELAGVYFVESNSCINSKSYRMAIMASGHSVYWAMYYELLKQGKFNQDSEIIGFNNVINCIKDIKSLSKFYTDVNHIRHARNAIAHPDEFMVVQKTGTCHDYQFEVVIKKPNIPNIKKKIFLASISNNLCSLKDIAYDVHDKTKNILFKLGFNPDDRTVIIKKNAYEKMLKEYTGNTHIELENI